jgi:hypothetical protein
MLGPSLADGLVASEMGSRNSQALLRCFAASSGSWFGLIRILSIGMRDG